MKDSRANNSLIEGQRIKPKLALIMCIWVKIAVAEGMEWMKIGSSETENTMRMKYPGKLQNSLYQDYAADNIECLKRMLRECRWRQVETNHDRISCGEAWMSPEKKPKSVEKNFSRTMNGWKNWEFPSFVMKIFLQQGYEC